MLFPSVLSMPIPEDVPMPIPEDVLMPEEKEKSRELDLSELPEIDEVPPEKPVPLSANQENLILAFWRFMLTHVIFNFMGIHMNSRKAIGKGAERSEVDTEELPIISTESDVLAEGAAALD